MKAFLTSCFVLMPVLAATLSAASDPLPPTIQIPLPGGKETIEFSCIPLFAEVQQAEPGKQGALQSEDAPAENVFFSRDFNMGHVISGDDASFRNFLAPSSVSGTLFYAPVQGKAHWVLPMGTTEVTRAQYAAVMGLDSPPEEEAQLPVVNLSYAQIQEFCDRLNVWLMSDKGVQEALRKLPVGEKQGMLYVRLPLEAEWEFAARGGPFVKDNEDPYGSDESEKEEKENLYFETDSDLREVKSTGASNPCGCYDMLGNVRELVQGEFRPEYGFGRVGGLVVRGGDYLRDPSEVFSYTREEVMPYIDAKGDEAEGAKKQPFRDEVTGFRLVFGSTIGSERLSDRVLQEQWQAYRQGRVSHRPGELVTDSLTTKLEAEKADLRKQLSALKADFDKLSASGKVAAGEKDELLKVMSNRMAEMTERMQQMENRVRKSQVVQAQASLQMIYSASADMLQNLSQLRYEKDRRKGLALSGASRDMLEAVDSGILILQENVDVFWKRYAMGCEALKEVDAAIVGEQEADRLRDIKNKAAADQTGSSQIQEKVFGIAMKHYRKYVQTGRLAQPECRAWYSELDNL